MGLDMYLKGRRYISKYIDERDTERSASIQNLFPELSDLEDRWDKGSVVNGVEAEVGYWRKANHIHYWFVENVQGGTDDCRSYRVDREQLTELRELCQRVLSFKHLANELLPTKEGFFFGNTEYGEYYYQDIEQTVKIIDQALKLPNIWEFEYHASW